MKPRNMAWGIMVLMLVLGAGRLTAATPQPIAPGTEGLGTLVNELRNEWNIPGVAVAIVHDKEVTFLCFGYRDLAQELPVTENTLFPIGSATKAFTATLLGILADQGKIDWDDPVRQHLPRFRLHDQVASERATIRDLLTHRTGLARHELIWYGGAFSRHDIFERLRYLQPRSEFREAFHYSNLIYMSAGYLVGQVMDSTWEELLRDRIFRPLKMNRANTSTKDMQRDSDFALPYGEELGENPPLQVLEPKNVDAVGPAGSINASVSGMATWLRLNLGDDTVDGKQLISAATLAEAHSPQVVVRDTNIQRFLSQPEMPYVMYGFGWYVQQYRGHRLIHHGGTIHGYTAEVGFLPDDGIGVVVLTNHHTTPFPLVLTLSLCDRLLGLQPLDWSTRYRQIKDKIIKKARDELEAGRKDAPAEPGHRPAAEPRSYAGSYENPGYGEMRIICSGGDLSCLYQKLETRLEHRNVGNFKALDLPFTGLTFSFTTNQDGVPHRLSVPLDSSVNDIVFTRNTTDGPISSTVPGQ